MRWLPMIPDTDFSGATVEELEENLAIALHSHKQLNLYITLLSRELKRRRG